MGSVRVRSQAAPAAAATAPLFTSSSVAPFTTIGTPTSYTITTSGDPTPTITFTGTVPPGMTFVVHGDGTATFSGTPLAGAAGNAVLEVTASNGVAPAAHQFLQMLIQRTYAPVSSRPPT